MILYFIGPSKAGKSTLLRHFTNNLIVDLDAEENRMIAELNSIGGRLGGWSERWERGLSVLLPLESQNTNGYFPHHLIDVGAGSLQTPEAFEFFSSRGDRTILITASFDILCDRHSGRDPEEFKRTEFTASHLALYSKLRTVDTSSSDVDRSVTVLEAIIREIFDAHTE